MEKRKINERVSWLGAIDWDRRLFDALIPLPDGTSYNAYLIEGGEKTVLLDTVDPSMAPELMSQLEGVKKLDYLVSHHAEQDHSGTIPAVLAKYPEAKLLCTPTAKSMLADLLAVPAARIQTVKDGESVSLGGCTLKFIYTPWVHWPETMVSYLEEDKILFSCDFFGSHLAASNLYVEDEARVREAAKRYFAEIMMPFRKMIKNNLEKLAACEIKMIAPSHGQVYREPLFIIDAYRDWALGEPKNLVALPFVSMHDSTRKMVSFLVGELARRGVGAQQFDLTVTDIGKLAECLVDAKTIVLGTPTVLAGPHPLAAHAAFLANALRAKAKYISVIGSYGWGGKTVAMLGDMLQALQAELLDPVLCEGLPKEADYQALRGLADKIKAKHEV